ncbi:MAG: hypothetical protein N3G19_02240 [Candidatus Pacearchaeota archaeon]|nr:hypothetical protein [Candidatus Pacearchaeota archaeon]
MARMNFRKLFYEILTERKSITKPDLVKIVAKKAKVTVSRVWQELEKPELRNKTIEEIIEMLEPKKYGKKDILEKEILKQKQELKENKKTRPRKELPKEVLEELYIRKNMNLKEISELYKMDKKTIKKMLLNYKIPLKSRSEVLSTAVLKGKKVPTKEELTELRAYQGKTIEEIANLYHLSIPFVCKLIKKYGVDKIDKEQFLRIKLSKIKSRVLENLDNDYKALKGLVGLIGLAFEEEDAFITAKGITLRYLEKLNGIYRAFSENQEGILEEIYLIYKNNKNKIESLLLHCLYNASIKIKINPLDVKENDNNFLILQKVFFDEIRKLYVISSLRKKGINVIRNNNS